MNIAFRSIVIYLVVLVGLRLTGKREVGQMASFELVLLLLIANAVQNAMTGPDTTLSGGLVAASTLLLLNWIMTRLVWRSKKFRSFVEGNPTLLIHQGKYLVKNMSREMIVVADIEQALREHGVNDVSEVALAVLEVDGTISVLRKNELPTAPRPHHRIRFDRRPRA